MNQTLLVIGVLVLLYLVFMHQPLPPYSALPTSSLKGCAGCKISPSPYLPTNHLTYDYLVDVRSEQEWLEGHVPSSLHIPIDKLVDQLPIKIPNKDASILMCCRRGIRASGAATIATKLGYTNVNYLQGKCTDLLA